MDQKNKKQTYPLILNVILFLMLLISYGCTLKTAKTMTQNSNNPLICDIERGICEGPTTGSSNQTLDLSPIQKPVKIIYFTDPICSSCWGIEPQLRRLKLAYGHVIDIEYHMGGLLADWSYNSGGISQPSDVAHHWDEVSEYYDMPIDGDIWLEDPLNSSFPPSIAFKAAQIQDKKKAILFLRKIREMVFLEKKNITKWEHLQRAAEELDLDLTQLKIDFESTAKDLFDADLSLASKLGVRGFPTIFFSDGENSPELIYGFWPYATFEDAIKKISPEIEPLEYDNSWEHLFTHYNTLTTREFVELSGNSKEESMKLLSGLLNNGKLRTLNIKNGELWMLNK